MRGKIVYVKWITREMVRAEPEARFVFGDNVQRVGYGGQAAAMRGEPNAIGVATKWEPGSSDPDFFTDDDLKAFGVVQDDLNKIEAALAEGRTVYIPADGLGTGLSELPTRAPDLLRHIEMRLRVMERP